MTNTEIADSTPAPDLARSAHVLRAMHEIASRRDLEFPEQVREILEMGCRQFEVPFGIVGAVDGEHLRVRHVVAPEGRLEEGDLLELCSTFCQEVLRTGESLGITDAAAPDWHTHAAYTSRGIRTYLGAPIRLHGQGWGTLCFFDYAPCARVISETDFELLGLIAKRVQIGLEHDSVMQRFRAVLEATARETGEGFLTSMVGHLARVLDADVAFVAACAEGERRKSRTLAVWKDGGLVENYEYDSEHAPCGEPLDGGVRHFPTDLQRLFPLDPDLAAEGLESFLGAPILGVDGSRLGHLVAVRRRRMDITFHDRWLMEVFAARAGSEIERQRSAAERSRLELEVLHAEKMKSLGVLAGGIAHDFNNLLMGILGNVDLAMVSLPENGDAHEKLARARAASLRAEELTKQMLIYAGQGPQTIELMCLNETAQEFADLLGRAVCRNAVVSCEFVEGALAMEGDASLVRQIIMNLVMNASDSMRGGEGRIVIRTGTDLLSAARIEQLSVRESARPGEHVYIEVYDTGSGMDDETRRRIFDPFYSTKLAGRGLGLSTVQGIVHRHGGAIDVESTPGAGTSVRVLFPASSETFSGLSHAPIVARGDARLRKTILVVDDEQSVREVITEMLAVRGMKVVTAATGEEALEALRARPGHVDLALLDLSMPHEAGGELAARIHELDATIPILLMSGFDEHAADAGRYSDAGVVAFVHKPFDFSALVEKLHEAAATADT